MTTSAASLKHLDLTGVHAVVLGQGLSVIDLSDPSDPVVGGSASIGEPRKVTIRGNYAYCSSKETTGAFHVVDISDPLNPTTAASPTDPNFERSFEIALRPNTAFVVGR